MWSEHIHNKEAVQGVFGSNVPALEGLQLMQIVLDGAGGLDVALNLEQLPDTVPARWKIEDATACNSDSGSLLMSLSFTNGLEMGIGGSRSNWTRAGCASLRRMGSGKSTQTSIRCNWNSILTAVMTMIVLRAGFLARPSASAPACTDFASLAPDVGKRTLPKK
jgi:hypothetical protein